MKPLILLVFLFPAPLLAGSYEYDWKSGNSYLTQPRQNGGATVRGYNVENGSTWTTTIDPNGNQSGYDADGNYWRYNSRSGAYFNFGTGKSCFGNGAARTCY